MNQYAKHVPQALGVHLRPTGKVIVEYNFVCLTERILRVFVGFIRVVGFVFVCVRRSPKCIHEVGVDDDLVFDVCIEGEKVVDKTIVEVGGTAVFAVIDKSD